MTGDTFINPERHKILIISMVNHGNRIQNSYNLLILGADSG